MSKFKIVSHDGELEKEIEYDRGQKTLYIWKIGSDDRPATAEDINDFVRMLSQAISGNIPNIVTHHNVSCEKLIIDA